MSEKVKLRKAQREVGRRTSKRLNDWVRDTIRASPPAGEVREQELTASRNDLGPGSTDWRTIDSAPRDGTTKLILASWGANGVLLIHVAALEREPPEAGESVRGDRTRPRCVGAFTFHYPTHWQPLPPAPVEQP